MKRHNETASVFVARTSTFRVLNGLRNESERDRNETSGVSFPRVSRGAGGRGREIAEQAQLNGKEVKSGLHTRIV